MTTTRLESAIRVAKLHMAVANPNHQATTDQVVELFRTILCDPACALLTFSMVRDILSVIKTGNSSERSLAWYSRELYSREAQRLNMNNNRFLVGM
jgi:hypothetical protein